MIYFAFLFTLSFLSFFNNKLFIKIILPIIFLVLLIFIGGRYEIGGDWDTYEIIFNQLEIEDLSFLQDLFYDLINLSIKTINLNIVYVNLICAFLCLSCIFFVISKFKYPLIALLILYPYCLVVVAMGYTRQSVALGICTIAIHFILQGKNILSIMFILLASGFHKSALFLLSYFLYENFKMSNLFKFKTYIYLIFSVCIVVYLYFSKMEHINALYLSNEVLDSKGALMRLLPHIIPLIIYAYFRDEFKKITTYKLLDFSVFCILVFFVTNFFVSTLTDRLNLYFVFFDIFVIDYFLFRCNKISKIIVTLFLIVQNFALFYVWYFYSFHAKEGWHNYQNYFLM